jgi:hypothetical protein
MCTLSLPLRPPVTSVLDPRIAAVTSPADNGYTFYYSYALNVPLQIYICIFSFSSLDFLYFFLVGLSIFVAFLRYK